MKNKEIAIRKNSCRACGNKKMKSYLDLGMMPLSNNLESTMTSSLSANRYPLQVEFCETCSMSQLTHVIDPDVLFSYYAYRSSINGGYKDHCKKMAESLMSKNKLDGKSFVIDIAGNDGALLKEFQDVVGCKTLNIDPAKNLCQIAESIGVKSLPKFWNFWTAREILRTYGEADIITATNVFAHVDDIEDFLRGVKIALKGEGSLILEFPYLVDLIERNEFDTVYFEHLSYLGILPVLHVCEKSGLRVYDIEKFPIHGGTVRVKVTHRESKILTEPTVEKYLIAEKSQGYTDYFTYFNWSLTVKSIIEEFSKKVRDLKSKGFKIAAFAASAKGNALLNSSKIDNQIISYIADETPEKIGKFSPGTGIPIVHIDKIREEKPDYIVILSWNFKQEIIEKLKKFYDGKFIVPIPHFTIIEK